MPRETAAKIKIAGWRVASLEQGVISFRSRLLAWTFASIIWIGLPAFGALEGRASPKCKASLETFELRGRRARDKARLARTRRREGGTRLLRQTAGGTHGLDHAHHRRSLRRHGNHRLRVGGNLSPTRQGPAARRALHPFRAGAKPNGTSSSRPFRFWCRLFLERPRLRTRLG